MSSSRIVLSTAPKSWRLNQYNPRGPNGHAIGGFQYCVVPTANAADSWFAFPAV